MKRVILLAVASLLANSSVNAQQYCNPNSPQCNSCNSYAVSNPGYVVQSSPVYTNQVNAGYSLPANTVSYYPSSPPNSCVVAQATYGCPTMNMAGQSMGVTQPVYQPVSYGPSYVTNQAYSGQSYQVVGTTSSYASTMGATGSGLAQQKAQQAAQMGIQGHVGGGLGGARFEGVGWSSGSAQDAIQRCCYWGTRPVAQIGVAQGSNGLWYACVLYN